MFTELEKKQLLKLNDGLSSDIKIGLAGAGHPQRQMFQKFCDNLVQLVPKIRVVKEDSFPPATATNFYRPWPQVSSPARRFGNAAVY